MIYNLRNQISEAISSAAVHMVAFLLALCLGLIGFVFLMVGLANLLTASMSTWQAFALVGAVLILAGLLVIAVVRSRQNTAATTQRESNSPEQERIEAVMALGEDIGRIMKRRPKETIATGFLVGIVLGASPELRRGFVELATSLDIETDKGNP